jgi:hypothetical protein
VNVSIDKAWKGLDRKLVRINKALLSTKKL